MKNINVNFGLTVRTALGKIEIYVKNFDFFVKENFLNRSNEKAHNLSNHIENFKEKVKINQQSENRKDFVKYSIYYVNFGMNIGNEINGIRPSIIFKSPRHNKGADIIVIPMTGLLGFNGKNKDLDKFDIIVEPDRDNGLRKDSVIKVRHIKSISKKRIKGYIGSLSNSLDNEYIYDIIDRKIKTMLGIKNPPTN